MSETCWEARVTPKQQVRRFLKSGDYDMLHGTWPGDDILAKIRAGDRALRQALVAEVRRRTKGRSLASLPDGVDQNELVDILAEAVTARNGWKRILRRCAPQS